MGSLVAELAEKLSSATNSIDFDEQTLFLNTSANTVGVGTNAPASKFDVRGTMQVGVNDTGYDVTFFGDAAGAGMIWDTSANALLVRGATADHATTSAGRLVLQTAQVAIAIGDVIGRIDFNAPLESSGTDALLVGASIWGVAEAAYEADSVHSALVFATGQSAAATEKMRIMNSGKVGIGTSAPTYTLEVNGNISSGAPTHANWRKEGLAISQADGYIQMIRPGDNVYSPYLEFQKSRGTLTSPTSVADDDHLGVIAAYGWDGTDSNSLGGMIQFSVDGTPGSNDMPGRITFHTTADGAAAVTERMRIDASGNVGIGTSAPDDLFHVYKGAASAAPHSDAVVNIEHNDDVVLQILTPADKYGALYFGDAAHTNDGGFKYDHNLGTMYIRANDANRMILDASGNVALGGFAAPVGHGNTCMHLPDDYEIGFGDGNGTRPDFGIAGDSSTMQFFCGNGSDTVDMSLNTSGYLYCPGLYHRDVSGTMRVVYVEDGGSVGTNASTRKAKRNIVDMETPDWIYDLRPVNFNYRQKDEDDEYIDENKGGKQFGLIAEEVDEVEGAETMVFRDAEGDPNSVEYSILTTVLLKAVQDLNTKVKALEDA